MNKEQTSSGQKTGKGAKSTRKAAPRKPRKKQGRGRSIDNTTKKKTSTVDDALSKKIAETKRLVIETDERDVPARYKVAVACQAVIAGDGKGKTYGAGAAKKLGKSLGWNKSTVYAYEAVAKAWNQEKFDELAAKRDKYGKPLSWSHIMFLATEKDAKRRRTFTKQTIDNGWSVRDLKKKVGGKSDETETTGAEGPKPPRPLVNAVDNYATALTTAKANADTFGQAIDEQIEHAKPEELKSDLLARLKQARKDLDEHYRTEAKRLDALIQAIESGEHTGHESADDSAANAHPVKGKRK